MVTLNSAKICLFCFNMKLRDLWVTTRENSSCHSKVTSESVPFRNTLGGFMTKVPQELGQGLCQPIFQKCFREAASM